MKQNLKMKQKMNRRDFFTKYLGGAAAITGAMIVLPACKGGSETPSAPKKSKQNKKADCSDLSSLTAQELKTREGLKYVDKTPKPAQTCANCKLYKKLPNGCGGCTLIKGPVAPEGWCSAWQPRA